MIRSALVAALMAVGTRLTMELIGCEVEHKAFGNGVVVGADGKVEYTQLVGEISEEPDYKAVMEALK